MEMERINLVTGITENRRKIQNLESNLLLKLTTVQVPIKVVFIDACEFRCGMRRSCLC